MRRGKASSGASHVLLNAAGLVSFKVDGDNLAFAVDDYRRVVTAISEAARRSLEEPIVQKKKKRQQFSLKT